MAEEGLKRLAKAEAFGLEEFYQECVGNIVISECLFNNKVQTKVFAFLRNNPEWVMGYENPDGDCGYYWLNTREDVIL